MGDGDFLRRPQKVTVPQKTKQKHPPGRMFSLASLLLDFTRS
jgi:hypothetical protein